MSTDSLLEFARGPLFRLSFAVLVLGLIRILFLDLWGILKAYGKTSDKRMPWQLIRSRSFEWVLPVKRMFRNRHIYSIVSFLFHIGLIAVPIFLFAHINLWKQSVGISWPALPYSWALGLALTTIVLGVAMLISRMVLKPIHLLSKGQDYFWLVLLLIPFTTGFICANLNISAGLYQFLMLVHVLAGDLIFLLIPFSKIAHCVLTPLSQVVGTIGWKFPAGADEAISRITYSDAVEPKPEKG